MPQAYYSSGIWKNPSMTLGSRSDPLTRTRTFHYSNGHFSWGRNPHGASPMEMVDHRDPEINSQSLAYWCFFLRSPDVELSTNSYGPFLRVMWHYLATCHIHTSLPSGYFPFSSSLPRRSLVIYGCKLNEKIRRSQKMCSLGIMLFVGRINVFTNFFLVNPRSRLYLLLITYIMDRPNFFKEIK